MANHAEYKQINGADFSKIHNIEFVEGKIRAEVSIGTLDYIWFDSVDELNGFINKMKYVQAKNELLVDNFIKDLNK
jgi:hypothetical protein